MEYGFSQYKPSKILRGHLNLGGSSPSGGSILVNSLYLERDGKPWIGVMGEYHYSRDSRENWAAELEKIRDGGVNIISTYIFWNYHEEEGRVRLHRRPGPAGLHHRLRRSRP